jgi:predicted nucleotidyltransferase
MLKKLIGSRIRVNLIKLFIFSTQKEYYVREIARLTKDPFDPVRRELIQLGKIGILNSRVSGRQKYYSINIDHPFYSELKSMVMKSDGIGETLRGKIGNREDVLSAFIYGSFARNEENATSDIDLFVVGDISVLDLQSVIGDIEADIKREINPAVFPLKELRAKFRAKNNFIAEVFNCPKIFLKGDEDGFRELVRAGEAA